MRARFLQVIIVLILVSASFCFYGSVVADDTQLYEYYNTGDDAGNGVYASYSYAQTFNVTSSHAISSVRLRLYRAGTAGYLYVGVKACNTSTGLPEGADLTSGIYDGSLLVTNTSGSFREVSLTEYTLAADTQYAIVCSGTGNDSSNGIFWRSDNSSPTYSGGYYVSSTDNGVSWTANTSRDFMFEIYGEASMDIASVQVYSNYGEDGDGWIFVVDYLNEVSPYYPDGNPENYYQLQLLDGSTVISSVPMQQWGRRPGSIFLNADAVSALEWGQDYTIMLNGTYGIYTNTSYTLDAADWIGEAYSQLDAWVISLAGAMETHDGEEYLTEGPDGYVLNTIGGAIFATGIPYLPEMRPEIFQYSLSTLEYTSEDWEEAYPDSLVPWESWMGDDITDLANDFGDMLGISGQWALGLFFFMLYLVISGMGVFTGHTVEGLIIASPLILLTMNWLIIPMALVATAIMLLVYKWVKREWFEST